MEEKLTILSTYTGTALNENPTCKVLTELFWTMLIFSVSAMFKCGDSFPVYKLKTNINE